MDSKLVSFERLDNAIKNIKNICIQNTESLFEIKLILSNLLDSLNNNKIKSSLTKEFENQVKDRKKVDDRLYGFDQNSSLIWNEICKKFGSSLSHNELLSIAQVIASNSGIKVDRDARRRKEVLIKWFDENAQKITPLLNYIKIEIDD